MRRNMRIGASVSGIGHATLIGWIVIGGPLFRPADHEPSGTIAVSLVSGTEFSALAPEPTDGVSIPEIPGVPAVEGRATTLPSADSEVVLRLPQPGRAPDPERQPDIEVRTPPLAEVADTVPRAPPVQDEDPPPARPAPSSRPVPRAAPTPVAPAPPDAIEDAIRRLATAVELTERARQPERREETAPAETARDIAAEKGENLAPVTSPRPPVRPVSAPDPTSGRTAAAWLPDTAEAVNAALKEALNADMTDVAAVPAAGQAGPGSSLTRSERDALRIAVSRCWNVGSLSSASLRTTVVVGVSMSREGRPRTDAIRLISFSDGSETAARQAYEAARRAIVRCGANGYELPTEKYAQWRDMEITFNPENMRIK
ncbi:MAG: energy transducer TonB [Pseudomonadota bacterium]